MLCVGLRLLLCNGYFADLRTCGGYFADRRPQLGPQNTHWLVRRSAKYPRPWRVYWLRTTGTYISANIILMFNCVCLGSTVISHKLVYFRYAILFNFISLLLLFIVSRRKEDTCVNLAIWLLYVNKHTYNWDNNCLTLNRNMLYLILCSTVRRRLSNTSYHKIKHLETMVHKVQLCRRVTVNNREMEWTVNNFILVSLWCKPRPLENQLHCLR